MPQTKHDGDYYEAINPLLIPRKEKMIYVLMYFFVENYERKNSDLFKQSVEVIS